MSAQKIDVLAMLLQMADTVDSTASPEHKAWHDEIMAARAAVAELIEAASNASSQFVTAVRGRADMRHIRELDAALARIGSAS